MLITYETRIKIELLLKEGYSLANIARRLNFSRSTITREIRRGTQDSPKNNLNYPTNLIKSMYRARDAQFRADNRQHHAGRPTSLTRYKQQILKEEIHDHHYTPGQVVAKHRRLFSNTTIIYTWINHNQIPGVTEKDLPMQSRRFKRSINRQLNRYKVRLYKTYSRKKRHFYPAEWNKLQTKESYKIGKRQSINDRPAKVNQRKVFSHWEMDGVEGTKNNDSLLVTFVERKTRFQVALKAKSKSALNILKVLVQFRESFGRYVKSITCDNGQEFVNSIVTQFILHHYLGDLYIANSYAPYERGTNERTNRNLRARWYFPKGTRFSDISQQRVNQVVKEIDSKPLTHTHKQQKSLQYLTRRLRQRAQRDNQLVAS
ncbi:IS30 family transposase [Weissella paramesenteroides]|uniref:IS30 family transposase n=1 Tax=Weissella paramesenteroides TaxID=1249 RepID=UPI003857F346